MITTEHKKSERLTGVRREVKYLMDASQGAEALARIRERITPKQVNGEAVSYRISIYLDTPERCFAKQALRDERGSTKVRLRDYYRLTDGAPRFAPTCFVEVKSRSAQMVEKSRFEVSREAVEGILREGPPPSSDPAIRAVQEAFELARQGRPLEPVFVAHYRRYTLQDHNRLRVTFDDMLSYHMARRQTMDTSRCTRKELPPPLIVEPMWIAEVKSIGLPPAWLEEILDVRRRHAYSKFGAGVHALQRLGVLFRTAQ